MANTANPQEAALSAESLAALGRIVPELLGRSPVSQVGAISAFSQTLLPLVEKLPEVDRNNLIVAINANPKAAANAMTAVITDAKGAFDPKKAADISANFSAFANKLADDVTNAPKIPKAAVSSPQIEQAMQEQLTTAFAKGVVNSGRTKSALSAQEATWYDQKMKDPAFQAQVAQETLAGFRIDKAAGTYDKAAFEKYIENPERTFYETAKRIEQKTAVPAVSQDFSTAATDPNQSAALAAFEKKMGETKPDLKKQYDAFAASHPRFRGDMAQILSDVPAMADAALENTDLLKVAMEDSAAAAKKVHENKQRMNDNAPMLKTFAAPVIRNFLGLPTPAGETPGLTADASSGSTTMAMLQMIGQFLTKIFPSLAPYVDQFMGVASNAASKFDSAIVMSGINAAGTQNTGDKALADAAKKADPAVKAADAKPAEVKPDTVVADSTADQRRRIAMNFGT